MQASLDGDAAGCERLLRRRRPPSSAVLHKVDAWGCTALHAAAKAGAAAVAEILIRHGGSLSARDAWDETPLHFAAREGQHEVCRLLLDSNAQVNLQNADGQTPLVLAAEAGHEMVCEMLLQHGAGAGDLDDSEIPPLLSRLLLLALISDGQNEAGGGGDSEADFSNESSDRED